MAIADAPRRVLRSGPFALDLDRLTLHRDGRSVPIRGLPLRILAMLMSAPGRVVSRAELKAALWPNSDRIDTERRLNTAMRSLRALMEDGDGADAAIETIRSHGYRWRGAALPPRREKAPARAAAAALLLAVLTGPWTGLVPFLTPEGAEPGAAERDGFLRAAALAEQAPEAAARELAALVAERPTYRAARVLQAQLAVRRWRQSPSLASLTAAKAIVGTVRRDVPGGPDTEVLMADLALGGDWDWRRADAHYRRALALDPRNPEARRGLAWLMLGAGHDREALAHVEALVGETALDDGLRADLGWLALRMGRADLALAFCAPSATATVNLLACRHTAFARRGAMTEARAAALSLMNRLGAAPADTDAVAQASPVAGYRRFLDWRATHFLPPSGHWFQRAQVLAEAGQTEAAINSLEQAAAARDPSMVKIRTTPEFRSLAGSERFQLLWRAVGPGRGSGRTSNMGGHRREG